MIQTTYYVASSIDGFIASADGGVDWLEFVGSDADANGYTEFFDSVDGLVMGRKTYDQVLTFGVWHYGDKPCWVMTHEALDEQPAHILVHTNPRKVVLEAEEKGVKHLWIVGGGLTASRFLHESCLDRVIVSVLPTVLSAGIPLLPGLEAQKTFSLQSHKIRSNGIAQLTYLVDRT